MSFIKVMGLSVIVCLSIACQHRTETTGTGGGGGTTSTGATAGKGGGGSGGHGGAGGDTGGSGGDVGGSGGGSATTSTPTEPTCTDLACASAECGQALYDCDGDGKKENHLCPDTCQAPAACGGDYTLNKCGTKCQVLPEYLTACGAGVEWACDVACGYCYKFIEGKPTYKSVGVDCPTAELGGGSGPMAVRCCVDGCC